MKKHLHSVQKFIMPFILAFTVAASLTATAQLQVDKQIQLTGSGADAKITGIQQVTSASDAVNAQTVQQNALTFATATGSANAYAVNLSPAVASYTNGMIIHFVANFDNTAAATLNVNGLGAATIKKNFNADLASGDIKNGQAVSVIYDGTNFQMLSQLGNASGGASSGRQLFACVGSDQYFSVPSGVTSLSVKLWGAGGGFATTYFANSGGGGAFVSGTLTVTPGQTLKIIVGENGGASSNRYGGGGNGVASQSGSGGGRSAIQINGTEIVTAAGGGGGGAPNSGVHYWGNGGGGGATTGSNGIKADPSVCANEPGVGGTTSSAGTGGVSCSGSWHGVAGSQFKGGSVNTGLGAWNGYGGGGGSGYYGGGSGASYYGAGGGGGSSYTAGSGFSLISNLPGSTISGGSAGPASAGGNTDPDYQSGIGVGGATNSSMAVVAESGNGLVILSW